jgi:signal transduction histidine kinase
LTVVRGYNSMLEDGVIPPEQISAVARILETKIAQMDLLIEQMLETARLEQSDLAYAHETLDLGDVAQEQVDVFRAVARDNTIVVQPADGALPVVGDRRRVGAIVANLLDNALKYSPEGEEIVCAVGTDGAHAFVSVCDRGPGIAREHMDLLFKRFGRLPTDQNLTVPGTGLGLFLCKEIAERHGGDITVRSTPGAGSEFTLRLPLKAA